LSGGANCAPQASWLDFEEGRREGKGKLEGKRKKKREGKGKWDKEK